jgi:hypothetical protein
MKLIISSLEIPPAQKNKLKELKDDERNILFLLKHFSEESIMRDLAEVEAEMKVLEEKKQKIEDRQFDSKMQIALLNNKLLRNREDQLGMLRASNLLKQLFRARKEVKTTEKLLRKEGIDGLSITVKS